MSSWFTPKTVNSQPTDSRSIGWSQKPNRRAFFQEAGSSPQASTGSGTVLDLGNTLSFGLPKTEITINPTVTQAQFLFENSQDVAVNNLTLQTNFSQSITEVLNQIEYGYETCLLCEDFGDGGRCSVCDQLQTCDICTQFQENCDLCTQFQENCDLCTQIEENCDLCEQLSNCSAGQTVTYKQVMVDLELTGSGLCYHTAQVGYNETGLIVSWDQDASSTCINTTTCP